MDKFKVTPYEVEGEIDYGKLVKEFGVSLVDENIRKHFRNMPLLMRRGYIYAHRDFDKLLKEKTFAIVSGRGVSERMHLGHLVLMRFVKDLQDIFGCFVFIPFSDDEKFLYKENLDFDSVEKFVDDNLLDVIAIGFDPKKTKIVVDMKNMNQDVYNLAMKCAKKLTHSTVKSAFGFTDEHNIGITFYPAMQAAHILYPSEKMKLPVVVPVAIDQDVFIRLARDIAEKSGLPKPAALLCKFLPGLKEGGKMSASDPTSAIYTTDTPAQVKEKIMKHAFSGGKISVEDHRKLGGNPDIDIAYQYLTFFEEDDKKLKKIYDDYKSGKMLTGELKQILIDKLNAFLKEHQRKREQARKVIDKFMLRD